MHCSCRNLPESCTTGTCFQEHWLFASLSDEQMAELRSIGVRRDIPSGSPVFMQGDDAGQFFLIKSGRIKLSKLREDGSEMTLDFRKAGDILGENTFVEESAYPLSAWAVEPTVTCGLESEAFKRFILNHPDIGLNVIKSMGIRMASMAERLDSMSEGSLENRLHRVLSHVAQEHGSPVSGGMELDLPLTHEELGFLVGAHRVSVTKAMKILLHSGKIARQGKQIILLNS